MERPSLHEESERIKRRRLNNADLFVGETRTSTVSAAACMVSSGSSADAHNADLEAIIFRQRLLAASNVDATDHNGASHAFALQQQIVGSAGAGPHRPSDDPILRIRQSLLSQQLSANSRRAADELMVARLHSAEERAMESYLRPSLAAGQPSSIYASFLNGHGGAMGTAASSTLASLPLGSSHLSDSVLLQRARAAGFGAASSNMDALEEQLAQQSQQMNLALLAGQLGQRSQQRQQQQALQELLEKRRLREAEAEAEATNIRRLLGASFIGAAGADSVFSRMQAESRMAQTLASGRRPSGQLLMTAVARGNVPSAANAQHFHGANPASVKISVAPGRQPIHLYMSCDDEDLSPYQCLVRKQIELFEAEEVDAETNARGRNRPIVVGQVGIRCKHCKELPPRKRARAAIYYPSKLDRLYQAGQTMASVHLGQHCNHIPPHIRAELARLRESKSAALGGKKYWSDGARALGVTEDDERLCFR